MPPTKFQLNPAYGSGGDVEKVKSLRRTDGRTDDRRTTDRRPWHKLTWSAYNEKQMSYAPDKVKSGLFSIQGQVTQLYNVAQI